jgi:hypothetical protein
MQCDQARLVKGNWGVYCHLTHKIGSYPLLVKRMPCRRRRPRRYRGLRVGHTCALVSWGEHEAVVEEIEVCPAKHLALQHFGGVPQRP